MLELLKVLVQPVVLERDEHGKIIGEQLGNAVPLYGEEEVSAYFASLEAELNMANERQEQTS